MKDIKIEYKRENNNNYILFFLQKEFWNKADRNNYEYRMLEENNIKGILKLDIYFKADEFCLRYKISSKKKLVDFISCKKLSYEDISKLIYGISNILFVIKEYLIDENDILIDIEYIYIDSISLDIYFCVVPGINHNFYRDLNNLLAGLLNRVDREDKRAVSLIYNLYQESMDDNYTIDDLLKYLYLEDEEKHEDKDIQDIVNIDSTFETDYTSKKEGFFIKNWFGKGSKKENIQYKIEQPLQEYVFNEESNSSEYLVEKADSSLYTSNHECKHTICLGQDNIKYESYRLISRSKLCEDIELRYFPFIIGKQSKVCDYVINQDIVSRIHLRIDKKGEAIIIKDLNSLNGTRINGNIIRDGEEIEIKIGDELEIAGLSFMFAK